jgi:aspartate-semialdehyde dehydrogenase
MSLAKTRFIVTGALSLLGRDILSILAEKNVPVGHVTALDAASSRGESVSYGDNGEIDVHPLEEGDFAVVDVVLHADEGKTTAAVARKISGTKAVMIDGSGVYNFDPDVPVVVPEVNGDALKHLKKNIVANPNSLSIFLALAINPLHKQANVKRIVASTYQSVSHWGRAAQDELFSQTKAIFMAQDVKNEHLPKQIAFNCYPMMGFERDDGLTDVEFQTIGMVKKIFDTKMKVAINTVTVPCFVGDGLMVNVECENEISPIKAALWMTGQKGLAVMEDNDNLPTHKDVSGETFTYVARLRSDMSVENGLSFWVMGDNLRKGSALNMVDIANEITK